MSALHQRALVVDGHSDILIPVTEGRMSLADRAVVPGPDWLPPPGLERHPLVQFGMSPRAAWFGCMGQYDVPRWVDGGVTAQLCAVYLDDAWLRDPFQRGMEMVWHLHDQVARNENLILATTAEAIREAKARGQIALVLSFEGCDALGGDPRLLDLYHRLGLRVASLTHTRRNVFADGCWAADRKGGLTPLGGAVVDRLHRLGIVVDLVHIAEAGFWEILDRSDRPVILSHSTSTMFPDTSDTGLLGGRLPRPRLEIPRDRPMLEAIARVGGVLGVIHFAQRGLDEVVRDIETAFDVMGDDHVGLGSDYYGLDLAPEGLEDIGTLPRLTEALLARGHRDETVIKFLGGNYLRVFEAVWGA